MFRVSVKLVVILLLIVTSGVVVFCVSIPIALQLQDNAMDFVLQELTSATEAVQAVVNRKLRLMENMADVLRKASSTEPRSRPAAARRFAVHTTRVWPCCDI